MKSDFEDRLRDEEVWWLAREIETGAGQRALDDLVARMAAENEYADAVLDGLLESEERFAAANVASDERFRTGGVVRRLCEAARAQMVGEPRFAMVLAHAAAVIGDHLPDDYYPARAIEELRGTAWKHFSSAIRSLGRFEGACAALDRAEQAYRRLPVTIIQLASVKFARAVVLWEQQDYRAALELARSARRDFAECGDAAGELDLREFEAAILMRYGDIQEAREIYKFMLDYADMNGDLESKARAAQNLGNIELDGGDFESASAYLLIALPLWESLGRQREVLRTRWLVARLALATGRLPEAERQLESLSEELAQHGLVVEAAEVQLDRAEALLLLGLNNDAAEACTALVNFFSQVGMPRTALTAVSLLSEAAAHKALTREKITRVREVLRELQLFKE